MTRLAAMVALAVTGLAAIWFGGLLAGLGVSNWVGTDYVMIAWVPLLLGVIAFLAITIALRFCKKETETTR